MNYISRYVKIKPFKRIEIKMTQNVSVLQTETSITPMIRKEK